MNRLPFAAFVAIAACGLPGPRNVAAQAPYPVEPARHESFVAPLPMGGASPGLFPQTQPAVPIEANTPLPAASQLGVAEPAPQAVTLSPPESRAARMPLPSAGGNPADSAARSGAGSGTFNVIAALVVVLGLFFAAASLLKRTMPAQARLLPREAVEILGRTALPGRRQGHLIRVGNKIALVSFSGGGGAETLVEITDPLEVDRLAGLCSQHDPHSTVNSFRSVVEQFFRDKPAGGSDTEGRRETDDV